MEFKQLSYKTIMQNKTTELHFPFLFERVENEWYMTYREGVHGTPEGDKVKCVQSKNKGEEWIPWEGLAPEPKLRWFRTKLENGTYISHRYRLKKGVNDYYGYILRANKIGRKWEKTRCDIYGLSISDDYAYMWGHIRENQNGELFVVVYGQCEDKYINVIMKSNDNGHSWNPSCYLGIDHESFVEGPCEADLVMLDDKKILAVYRTGGPLIYALSENNGGTWKHFVLDDHGVSPQLLDMNGVVVCTYGTRDVKMRYFVDGKFSLPITVYKGSGSGYTDMQRLDKDRFRIVFDQSDFNLDTVRDSIHRISRVEYKIIR